jgi:hypothetical protein
MTSLLDRPPGAPLDVRPAPTAAAVAAAAQAVAASLVAVLAPVVLAWVLDSDGRGTWLQAVRFSLGLWLLAQHGGLVVDGGHVGLVPLGLTLAPAAACWFGGRRLSRVLDPRAEAIAAGATRSAPAWPPAVALAAFAAAYCTAVAFAALVADMPGLHPIGLQAVLGAAVLSSVGVTLGAAAYRYRGAAAGLVRLVTFLPPSVARCCGPAAAAVAVQVGAAGVVLAGLLAVGSDRVLGLHRALEPGVAGGAVLTLGQALLVPNLVLWTAAALTGPGFALGTGSWVTLSSARLEALPALPVLGALPAPGRLPLAALALLAVPVTAGAVAGTLLARSYAAVASGGGVPPGPWAEDGPPVTGVSWRRRVADAAGVATLAGVAMGVLAWLSGGPAGPGRLAQTGPVPWLTGTAFAVEVAAGVALALVARSTLAAVRGSSTRRARD